MTDNPQIIVVGSGADLRSVRMALAERSEPAPVILFCVDAALRDAVKPERRQLTVTWTAEEQQVLNDFNLDQALAPALIPVPRDVSAIMAGFWLAVHETTELIERAHLKAAEDFMQEVLKSSIPAPIPSERLLPQKRRPSRIPKRLKQFYLH